MANLFRSEAEKKLRDPQQLDAAITLTSPSAWVSLVAMGLIVGTFLVWAFLGTLPFQGNGLGVLVPNDSEVFPITATAAGQIEDVVVDVGQEVRVGQVVATIQVPEIGERVISAERTLSSLIQQRDQMQAASDQDVANKRRVTNNAVAAQRSKIRDLQTQLDYLEERRAGEEQELAKRFITRETLQNTIDQLARVRQQISAAEIEIANLRAQQNETERSGRQRLQSIDQEILQAENTLDELRLQFEVRHTLTSPINGVVREISATIGDTVAVGARMVTITQSSEGLQMAAYMPIAKGKLVEEGMEVRVSPSTVERDIYGSIKGTVVSVGFLPATSDSLMDRFEDEELVETILQDGAPIEVIVQLEEDPTTVSKLAWSSSEGPPVQVSPWTTATATITVREVKPVDLFIPIVQTWVTGR